MKRIYLDSAATTQLRPEVIAEMARVLESDYGNPSSTHSFGRDAKSTLELSRKSIAKHLNCSAQEIIFTSGGTEADNWILLNAVSKLGVKRIISSRIEHHAVLHTLEYIGSGGVRIDYVKVKTSGDIDYDHLSELLSDGIKTLVSLMHVNNEIGTVLDLEKCGSICRQYNAYFHSDTIQSIGKVKFDLSSLPVDFLVASAHKFHGPKGIGFAFVRKGISMDPMLFGGEQEKGLRAGTEAIHNIAGMAKALEIAMENIDEEFSYISELKQYAADELSQAFPGARINGSNTFYNILNVCLPFSESKSAMILFALDMKGIAISRGSACQSGSAKPSHVLAELLGVDDLRKPSLRISFSHYNSREDIDALVGALKAI